ncbi:MAG: chromosomal replication initiator protein DnaA [Acidobacteriota bacterium]|nr:MAG: chromosomal replication initiator protein DnaA [Acidobacteriota bacterium]
MNEVNHWESLLAGVEKRVNHESFTTWFKPIKFLYSNETNIVVEVPDRVFEDWILNNYLEILEESLVEADLSGRTIIFRVADKSSKSSDESTPAKYRTAAASDLQVSSPSHGANNPVKPDAIDKTGQNGDQPRSGDSDQTDLRLNQRYTFDTFVVGSCNQFAHAAALAVAESTSKTYNPLYIYGGVGLGKTHLMCAIGHRVKERNRHLRLCYISAEKFMNELINAIRYDQTINFRHKYRSIDVLLIDDIQFLAGKERTQDEFFHTFNALYEDQKQIVISSDCAPREIPTLEERLHSRFEWGLIADIQPPDLETKVAILRKKAETDKLNLPDNVALFIANKIKSNIRELEGSLVRLTALSSLRGEPINLNLAQEALKNLVQEEERAITIESIQKVVAEYYGLKVAELKSKSNTRNIAQPRQIAMYLCKTLTKASLPEIGREFGGKHHTTVIHSINKISAMYDQKGHIHRIINSLIDSCK